MPIPSLIKQVAEIKIASFCKNKIPAHALIKGDPRYSYGLPLTGKGEITNANYLWMQIFAMALNDKGRAGFVMANSATDAGNAEKEIRKKMIEAGIFDIIISVGTNMFMNERFPVRSYFLIRVGQTGKIRYFLLMLQDIFTVIDRAHNEWSDEQIQEIATIARRYRKEEGEGIYEDIKGRCKVATLEEVQVNDYSLNPGRYVEIIEKEISIRKSIILHLDFIWLY